MEFAKAPEEPPASHHPLQRHIDRALGDEENADPKNRLRETGKKGAGDRRATVL
jgi:hypothetical protein